MPNNLDLNQCTITLTESCNLRCAFCFSKKNLPNNTFIDFDDIKRIINFCGDAKIQYVVLTGGEPTLYPRLLDTIRYIKTHNHEMFATITTNGTLLDNYDYCRELVDSGLDYIDISLKGRDRKSFYATTGCDCLSQQLEAINNFSKLSIDSTCSMVITPENVNYFCETIKKAKDNGAKNFSFTFVIDNETTTIKDEAYLKLNNPFLLVDSFISQIDKLNAISDGAWWIEYSYPLCVYTEYQLKQLEGRLAEPCQIHKKNGITFDAKMNLLPCIMNINTIIGQFHVDFSTYQEFRELVTQNPYKNTVKILSKLPSTHCQSCNHLSACSGGCTFFWEHCSFDALNEFKKRYTQTSKNFP